MNSHSILIQFPPFEKQRRAAKLLHLLAGFLLIMNAYAHYKQQSISITFLVVQMSAAFLVLAFAATGKGFSKETSANHRFFRLLEAAMFIYASVFFYGLNLVFPSLLQAITGAGILILSFAEKNIFEPTQIRISEIGIELPHNFKKNIIAWSSISNMIIKNDFISIDTKNNQFLQYEISEMLTDEKIDAINAFCRGKFTASP